MKDTVCRGCLVFPFFVLNYSTLFPFPLSTFYTRTGKSPFFLTPCTTQLILASLMSKVRQIKLIWPHLQHETCIRQELFQHTNECNKSVLVTQQIHLHLLWIYRLWYHIHKWYYLNLRCLLEKSDIAHTFPSILSIKYFSCLSPTSVIISSVASLVSKIIISLQDAVPAKKAQLLCSDSHMIDIIRPVVLKPSPQHWTTGLMITLPSRRNEKQSLI